MTLGSDLAGVMSIDYALSTVSGRLALGQAILRRLTTPRGGLLGNPAYGYSVHELIGSTVPESVIEHRVLEQVRSEEEVEDARCTVRMESGIIHIDITVEDSDGPFELTIAASELTFDAFLDSEQIFSQVA